MQQSRKHVTKAGVLDDAATTTALDAPFTANSGGHGVFRSDGVSLDLCFAGGFGVTAFSLAAKLEQRIMSFDY